MAYKIPERLKELRPYSYQKEGFIRRLDINESYIQPPKEVQEAIARRIAALPLTDYPESYANRVRELLAARHGVDKDEIVVSNGSDELISIVIGRLLRPGDRILTTEMDFGGYAACANIYGQSLITIPRDSEMFWSADSMVEAIGKHNPELVIFSTPSNPVGRVMPKRDVLRIIDAAADSLVVVDEAYMDFSAGQSVVGNVNDYNNLIVFKTLSKAYGLAGIRLGYGISNTALTRVLHAVRDVYNVSALSQIAAEEVLNCPEHLADSVLRMRKTTVQMYEGLLSLKCKKREILNVYPTDANFVLARFKNAPALKEAVAAKGFALRLFSDGLIRISCANEKHTQALLDILGEILV